MSCTFKIRDQEAVHFVTFTTTPPSLPDCAGRGVRMFEDRYDMQLVKAGSFENGAVMLRYKTKK